MINFSQIKVLIIHSWQVNSRHKHDSQYLFLFTHTANTPNQHSAKHYNCYWVKTLSTKLDKSKHATNSRTFSCLRSTCILQPSKQPRGLWELSRVDMCYRRHVHCTDSHNIKICVIYTSRYTRALHGTEILYHTHTHGKLCRRRLLWNICV